MWPNKYRCCLISTAYDSLASHATLAHNHVYGLWIPIINWPVFRQIVDLNISSNYSVSITMSDQHDANF